ncbi:glycosyltransferase family 2 protein [Flavobacterium sp. W21_SRS_FM6]|uniref:glycosyltransferase family 2 protein n=1 Tax=Flavobacterium sp. W21_SRS_FM6 TaxID=3240268 RepID=UPI003F933506
MNKRHDKIKFSVVITTYNRPDYLAESLAGVLQQTLPPFEIIVINDHSTTSYEPIIVKLEAANVHYHVNTKSFGANYSRNKGIELAQGDVIAFLDDDDIWFPEYLATVEQTYFKNSHAVGTTCGRRLMHDHSIDVVNKLHEVQEDELRLGNTYCGMSGVTVLSTVAAETLFDEDLENGQDWDFFVRIVQSGKTIINITAPLFFYRVSINSGISGRVRTMHPSEAESRLVSSIKHKAWLGQEAFNDRVAHQLLVGIFKRSYKFGWIALCIKVIGLKATLKYLISRFRK